MSWISDAGAGRDFAPRQFALPDFRLSLQLYGTHWRQVQEGWSYPDHDHPLFELNIVLEGRQVMTLEGTEYELEEGDLLLIQPGIVHRGRIGQSASMTYFCLHIDIDDAVYYERIAKLGSTAISADSELARKVRPFFDAMASLSEAEAEREDGADAEYVVRAAVLNILLALGEYAGVAAVGGAGQAAEPARRSEEQSSAIQRLRERNALEKKVQEMFSAPPNASLPVNKSLPPFRWAGLFSVMIPDRAFWTKPERFWAKILLEDALFEHGSAVVIVGEQLMTAVLFSDRFTVPPVEEYATRSKSLLEKKLNVAIRLGIGGIAPAAGELPALYKQSLGNLGMDELYPAPKRDFDFISRIIRLAMLMVEADYADPELSLGKLAKKLELTPNYLSALFTAETGHTFTWHLSRMRIDRAQSLLKETNMKVYQIGRLVGYADQAYFSRLFKTVVGLSPGEYRAGASAE